MRAWTALCIGVHSVRRHGGALGDLARSNKASNPPKLKHETLYISWDFVNF